VNSWDYAGMSWLSKLLIYADKIFSGDNDIDEETKQMSPFEVTAQQDTPADMSNDTLASLSQTNTLNLLSDLQVTTPTNSGDTPGAGGDTVTSSRVSVLDKCKNTINTIGKAADTLSNVASNLPPLDIAVGGTGTIAVVGGMTVGAGIHYNTGTKELDIYGTIGGALGLDMSAGIQATVTRDGAFNGDASSVNAGLGNWGVSAITNVPFEGGVDLGDVLQGAVPFSDNFVGVAGTPYSRGGLLPAAMTYTFTKTGSFNVYNFDSNDGHEEIDDSSESDDSCDE